MINHLQSYKPTIIYKPTTSQYPELSADLSSSSSILVVDKPTSICLFALHSQHRGTRRFQGEFAFEIH